MWIFIDFPQIKKCQEKGIKPAAPSNTSVVPGAKKEIIRVYITSETFKSVAVTLSTTVKEVGVALARKMNIVGSFHLDEFMISAFVDGKGTLFSPKTFTMQNQS